MAVIDGYTFAIDMTDRGVTATLRQVKAEASAMKAAMRSGFETIRQGEGTLAAYNYKIGESNRQIENYRLAIEKLAEANRKINESRKDGEALSEKDATAYAKNARQIENYKRQISLLNTGIQEAKVIIHQYATGLAQTRAAVESLHGVTRSYSSLLAQQNGVFTSARTKAKLLASEYKLLNQQSKLETQSAQSLAAHLKELQGNYATLSGEIRKTHGQMVTLRQDIRDEILMNGQNSAKVKELQSQYRRTSESLQSLRQQQTGLAHSMGEATNALAKQATKANEVKAKLASLKGEARAANPTGIRRIGAALDTVSAKASAATKHTRAFLTEARASFAGAGVAAGLATAGIGKTVQMAASLQQQWVTMKNLMVTGGEQATTVTRNLATMQRDATKYSKEYGFSQKEIANQYTELIKRGYSSESALGSMKDMLEAARATGDDFNDVVKNSASVLDAFNLRSSNATTMLKNTHRVVNAMAYAADMTATNFQDMGLAMSYVSASAEQAGFTVEQTSAALGMLSNAGIEGSKAGTGLRKTINSIISPTAAATEALQKYGLSLDDFKDKSGKLKPVDEIFKLINQHTAKLSKADKGAFFKAVFGTTGMQAAEVLAASAGGLKENDDRLTQLIKDTKEAENGSGYVHQLAQKNMATTQMRVKQLQMTMQDMAINVGNKLLPAVNEVAIGIGKWAASSAGQQTIQKFSDSIASLGKSIGRHSGSIMSFLGGFATGLMDVGNAIGKTISGISKITGFFAKLFGFKSNSGDISRFLGVVAGGLAGITISVKVLNTLFSGVRAISKDIAGLFGLQSREMREQNALMQEYIRLQERSLAIQEAEAHQQGIATGATGSKAGTVASTVATTAATLPTGGVAKGVEQSGAKAGLRYASSFASKLAIIPRRILGVMLPSGILELGSKAGRTFATGFFTTVKSLIVRGFGGIGKDIIAFFRKQGRSSGEAFAKAFPRSIKSGIARSGQAIAGAFSKAFNSRAGSAVRKVFAKWIIPEDFKVLGRKAASWFGTGLKATKKIKLNPRTWFSGVQTAAEEAGTKAGSGLVIKLAGATKSTKLAALGKGMAKSIADPLVLAFGAVDLIRTWNTSDKKNRAANVGKSIGNTAGSMAGMTAGASIGASLGSVVPGIGNVIGGALGGIIGAVAGGHFGAKFGKAVGPLVGSFVGTIQKGITKHKWDWSSVGKQWKDFWQGMGSWWDQLWGKKAKETKNKAKEPDTFKSSSNVQYSKEDVANLKSMTRAVDDYKKAIRSLKSVVKENDPSKEMNKMLSNLKKSVSGWDKLAKPIKTIGDAFKYLSQFSTSMAKKDAFAAFNKDLPILAKTVEKYRKKLPDEINDLGKALSKSKLQSSLKSLDGQLKTSTKNWKSFDKPVSALAKSFKTLQSAVKTFTGKNGLGAAQQGFKDLNDALKNQKIGSNLKKMAKQIKSSGVVKELSSITKNVKDEAKDWKALAKPVKTAAKSFDTLSKAVKGLDGKKTGFTQLNANIKTLTKTLSKNKFGEIIADQAKIASEAMSGKKSGFVTQFNAQTKSMTNAVRSFGRAFKSNWQDAWSGLASPVNNGLDKADTAEYHVLATMQSRREKFQTAFLKGWNAWIEDVKSNFRNGFNKLPDYAGSAMSSIVGKMNKGISGVNAVISDFGGDKKLSTIKYADGTRGGHPGGHMLINDSVRPHWKELVKFPGQPWQMFNERNVLVPNAPRGTQVLSGEVTHKVMKTIGVSRYADGTDDSEEMIEKMIKNPLATLKGIFFKATSFNGAPVVTSFGTALANGFLNAIKDKMKEMAKDAEDANSPAGQMSKSAFRKVALRAAKLMGQSLSGHDIDHLYWQAFTESTVNPAQNGGYDDHDGTGLPIGLFQFKRGTWGAAIRHLPGNHHNIHSALDQIMAVLADRNWRSDFPPMGVKRGWSPSGYANGGIVGLNQLIEVAEGNLPESIIPFDLTKRPRALNLMNQTLDHMEKDGGGTGNIRRVNDAEDSKFKNNVVSLLAQIAGLSQQQIDAILAQGKNSISARHARQKFYHDYGQDQHMANYMRP